MDFYFFNWLKDLFQNGVDREYLQKAYNISLEKIRMFPFSFMDRVKLGNKLDNLTLEESPIFIIGHWRSGTTHLHNLITQDSQFGYVSFFQSFSYPGFITGNKFLRPSIEKRVSSRKRPMDNMYVSLDTPQEEEFALMNMSFYNGFLTFPKNARRYFEKYVLFNSISEKLIKNWERAYIRILKKISYVNNGKRLILKNPLNTARIKILLKIFPNAKFVHIYRNPYIVYSSTVKMRKALLTRTALQKITEEQIEEDVLFFYKEIMNKSFEEQKLIPPENLVEIRYEDLEERPIEELKRLYQLLNIPNFYLAEENFNKYLDSRKTYQKNEYELSTQTIEKINEHWDFAIDKWQYKLPLIKC